jgi:excisionase family DNA binding protein
MSSRLLTVDEFAQEARISRVTVFRLIKSNAIPSIKLGHARRIPEAALSVPTPGENAES